jgi:hypothetical protein
MDDNSTMKQTRPIELPVEQADRLEEEAKAMGLPVAAYIEFLRSSNLRKHDAKFVDAARYVFKNYPKTLKKLAE